MEKKMGEGFPRIGVRFGRGPHNKDCSIGVHIRALYSEELPYGKRSEICMRLGAYGEECVSAGCSHGMTTCTSLLSLMTNKRI